MTTDPQRNQHPMTSISTDNSHPSASRLSTETRWHIDQAVDFYRLSMGGKTPGSREANRKKFIASIRELLPLVGRDRLLEQFRYGINCNTEIALGTINDLANAAEQVKPQAADAITPVPVRQDQLGEVRRLLNDTLKALDQIGRATAAGDCQASAGVEGGVA